MKIARLLSLYLFFTFLSSCHYEETREQTFSISDACTCFENGTEINPDRRFEECLKPLIQFGDRLVDSGYNRNDALKLVNMGISKYSQLLRQSCISFRTAYLSFIEQGLIIEEVHTAINIISDFKKNSGTADKYKYAKALATVGEYNKAISTLDNYLSSNDDDVAYWLKSYCSYKNDRLNQAIETLDVGIANATDETLKARMVNYRDIISPIPSQVDDQITLSITKDEL